MKTRIVFLLGLLSLSPLSVHPQKTETEVTRGNLTDRVVVKYHPEPTRANALGFIKQGATYGGFGVAAGKQKDVFKLDSALEVSDVETLANGLKDDPQVAFAEPDYIMQTMQAPNDARYNEQWHYYDTVAGINLPAAWDITTGSSSVVVAVIDSGVIYHRDLQDNLVTGYDFISDSWMANDGNGRDSDPRDPGDAIQVAGGCINMNGIVVPPQPTNSSWHGTHVAGTIAAESNNSDGVSGVAWSSKVMPLRALGRCGGYFSDILDAMRWAAGLSVYGVPNNPTPAKVINMSLGGSKSYCPSYLQSVINEVVNAGTTIVVAAGNDGRDASYSMPANCDNVITVGAIDRGADLSWYSNYGSKVDVVAPGGETYYYGEGVLSTGNTGLTSPSQDTYVYYQGTSMATPHVAGVAALIYSTNPNIPPWRVEQIIKNNARAFTSGNCTTALCGTGILDAGAAVLDASDEAY